MTDSFALALAGARGLASTLRRVGLTPHACDVWIVEDPDGDCAHVYLDDPSVDRVVVYTVGTLDRPTPSDRLEYLRSQIRAECISYGGLAELQNMADLIDPGDVELLEWADVPEFPEDPPSPA